MESHRANKLVKTLGLSGEGSCHVVGDILKSFFFFSLPEPQTQKFYYELFGILGI